MTAEFSVAVHAMVYLMHTNRITSSQELADNICTNPARVRKVMTKLHQADLVFAQKGKGSGYRTIEEAHSVSLDRILQALGQTPISMNWRSGDLDKQCLISSGMGAVMDSLYADLNQTCMQRLETMSIGKISDRIFV